ncbi:hypothetical protein D3C81_1755380 [compost metagenome]
MAGCFFGERRCYDSAIRFHCFVRDDRCVSGLCRFRQYLLVGSALNITAFARQQSADILILRADDRYRTKHLDFTFLNEDFSEHSAYFGLYFIG